jgi:hypothetical protein
MNKLFKLILCGVLVTSLVSSAMADPTQGLAIAPNQLSLDAQNTLKTQIDLDRARVPAAFQSVQRILIEADALNQQKRGQMAPFSMIFKRIGPSALMPMLEVLAFDAPALSSFDEGTQISLRAGLVEAVGMLRDVRSAPVLKAVLSGNVDEYHLIRSTTEALARLGDDDAVSFLLAYVAEHPERRLAIWSGLGDCRRAAVAQYLAQQLTQTQVSTEREILVEALRDVGNSWAWQTPAVQKHQAEELQVRTVATHALIQAYVNQDARLGKKMEMALRVIDHPEMIVWVQQQSSRVPTAQKANLSGLAERLQTARDRRSAR